MKEGEGSVVTIKVAALLQKVDCSQRHLNVNRVHIIKYSSECNAHIMALLNKQFTLIR